MILGIDTSTIVSSVALIDNNKVLAELNVQHKLTHSEMLMPNIDTLLKLGSVNKGDLTAIAVSIGPGSFTGLRIGLATAKALAYALKIPIVGVSSLEALAYNFKLPEIYIMPLLDAQKGNCYTALYCWENEQLSIKKPAFVENLEDILDMATGLDKKVLLLGESAVKYAQKIVGVSQNIILASPQNIFAKATSVGLAGANLLNSGRVDDVMTLEPCYIRKSEAEVLWEKRNKSCNV